MSRLPRLVIPETPHHITQRGVRKLPIFYDDHDRRLYLKIMRESGEKYGVKFCCWCLMNNHVHIVAIPEEEGSLAKTIGNAHHHYTVYFNEKQNITGHLFSERFFSTPMDDIHSFAVVSYIHNNPVRAGIAATPDDYKWSSASFFLGENHNDLLVNSSILKDMSGDWSSEFMKPSIESTLDLIRKSTSTGKPCGDESFVSRIEELTGIKFSKKKAGRPKLTDISH